MRIAPSQRLNIVVAGMVARVPGHGGATWAVLQYLIGLERLGHDVHFVEFVGAPELPSPGAPFCTSRNVAYCDAALTSESPGTPWTLIGPRGETAGTSMRSLELAADRADVLIDISGCARHIAATSNIPVRLYLDLDPGFTQWWQFQGEDVGFAGHTHYATVGTNIGHIDSPVPDCGVDWITTLPPVVMDRWPVAALTAYDAFTTVGNWRSYGSVSIGDRTFGQRAHSFRAMAELPERSGDRFAVALAIDAGDAADRKNLCKHGWEIVDPASVAHTPPHFQQFVAGSTAEIGIAKDGYVAGRTGWVSDRSAAYLASGWPVLAQDTAVDGLPLGSGLLTFSGIDEAAETVSMIRRDYEAHSRAARALAAEYLESDGVLRRLLDNLSAR